MVSELEKRQMVIDELTRYKNDNPYGFIVGVEVSKAKPWPPAAEMLKLRKDGFDVKAISEKVGYSIRTVERNLKTKGIDPRVGPQCDKHLGKVFSIDDALLLMPIPCQDHCACNWRTVLKSDLKV